ncbi:MAG: TIGR02281 family clan AA aspartic protease [Gammaproteobacteria bacterium]|nr:MAG: TIGR02281 family clan AA aspartic protease [Gammaproteobacteria bacterium]
MDGDKLIRNCLIAVLLSAMSAAVVAVNKITVVGLFKDTAIVVIDGTRRLLRSGDVSPEGVTLISATSTEAVLEIDGEQKRYALGGQISGSYARPEQATVRIWPTPDRMYAVLGSINGYPVDFIVDTGATLVSLSARQARRLGIDYRVVGTPGQSSTASGIDKIYVINLDRVKVGDIELRNVQGAVHDGDFPPATLLGMSFLGRLNIRQDGQVLELRKKY